MTECALLSQFMQSGGSKQNKQQRKETIFLDRNSIGRDQLRGPLPFPSPCPREKEKVCVECERTRSHTVHLQMRDDFGLSANSIAWPPPLFVWKANEFIPSDTKSFLLCSLMFMNDQGTNSSVHPIKNGLLSTSDIIRKRISRRSSSGF